MTQAAVAPAIRLHAATTTKNREEVYMTTQNDVRLRRVARVGDLPKGIEARPAYPHDLEIPDVRIVRGFMLARQPGRV